MKVLLMILSYLGLGLTILPSFFVFIKMIDFNDHIVLMLIGTIVWFCTSPFWMNRVEEAENDLQKQI